MSHIYVDGINVCDKERSNIFDYKQSFNPVNVYYVHREKLVFQV